MDDVVIFEAADDLKAKRGREGGREGGSEGQEGGRVSVESSSQAAGDMEERIEREG